MNKKASVVIGTIFMLSVSVLNSAKQPHKVDDTGWTQKGLQKVVEAQNRFAFSLYLQLRKEQKDKNIFFSPYSISTALVMIYEGARGKTAKEMRSVLYIPEEPAIRRANLARIINVFNKPDKKYKLLTANALWAQKDYRFLNDYFKTVEKYYGGKATNLDFKDAEKREKSRRVINVWVEEQTGNRIKDLIPQGVLSDLTRLVLTNAIYFKGKWMKQFNPRDTKDENFTTITGKTIKVPMMRLTDDIAEFNYVEIDGVQILEMPYDSDELSMLILLPGRNKLDNLEKSLTLENLSRWKSLLIKQRVDVYLPRFKFETKYFMVETLSGLGMPTAFSRGADFSGMDGTKNLFIQNVIHQAFVEVNEEGTEAAAATGVVVGVKSIREIPVFRADRPFIFIIQHKDTGGILFLGRVVLPTK